MSRYIDADNLTWEDIRNLDLLPGRMLLLLFTHIGSSTIMQKSSTIELFQIMNALIATNGLETIWTIVVNVEQRWMRRSKMQPRYINANELKSRIDLNEHNAGVIEKWIDMCPTADVKPVVHSHWRFIGYATWKCTECGYETMDDEYKFCPECGATMDENKEDYRTCISKQ